MWTNIVSKKKSEQEHASDTTPTGSPVPIQSENIDSNHMEPKRTWASAMRLPSFSSPAPERTTSATLGEATAAMRASFQSDDSDRPSMAMLRRSSTESTHDPCEAHADCLGGGSEGISSLYSPEPRRGAFQRFGAIASGADATFDLDHVYNNWPSA